MAAKKISAEGGDFKKSGRRRWRKSVFDAPNLYYSVLRDPWAGLLAEGLKQWECNHRSNQFRRVRRGDYFLAVRKGTGMQVVAVAQIAGQCAMPRQALLTLGAQLPVDFHCPLGDFLGDREEFGYMGFSAVWDVRDLAMNLTEFCRWVGLPAQPRTVPQGLVQLVTSRGWNTSLVPKLLTAVRRDSVSPTVQRRGPSAIDLAPAFDETLGAIGSRTSKAESSVTLRTSRTFPDSETLTYL